MYRSRAPFTRAVGVRRAVPRHDAESRRPDRPEGADPRAPACPPSKIPKGFVTWLTFANAQEGRWPNRDRTDHQWRIAEPELPRPATANRQGTDRSVRTGIADILHPFAARREPPALARRSTARSTPERGMAPATRRRETGPALAAFPGAVRRLLRRAPSRRGWEKAARGSRIGRFREGSDTLIHASGDDDALAVKLLPEPGRSSDKPPRRSCPVPRRRGPIGDVTHAPQWR